MTCLQLQIVAIYYIVIYNYLFIRLPIVSISVSYEGKGVRDLVLPPEEEQDDKGNQGDQLLGFMRRSR